MSKRKKKDQAPYEGVFRGRIQDYEYDRFNDLERITFYDQETKASLYIEIPHQLASFEGKDEIEVQIFAQDTSKSFENASIVFNGRLFHVRDESAGFTASISSGGLQLKITTSTPIDFRTEVTDRYKIVVY